MVSLTEAKSYIRVDYDDDDGLIQSFIETAESLTSDTIRRTFNQEEDPIVKTAVLYAVSYLYDHREDAKMDELQKQMRYILSTQREPSF